MDNDLVNLVCTCLDTHKADHINIMDFADQHALFDYFVIADAVNLRQLQALSDYVEAAVRQAGYPIHHIEKSDASTWILLDLGDVIVHLFLIEDRQKYQIDKLWHEYLVS